MNYSKPLKMGLLPGFYVIQASNFVTGEVQLIGLDVTKIESEFETNDISTSFNNNNFLIVTLKDCKGNPIVGEEIFIDLNGVNTFCTDKNGQVKVSTNGLKPVNKYEATITFNGNDLYTALNTTVKVVVNKAGSVLTAEDITTVYNGGKDLVITLKDVNGKPISGAIVTVVLGGKTYNPTTDKNGQVKISTNGLKPVNKYWATITFNGNANYDKSSTTAKVKVNKAYPKFKYSVATFKKSDKKKKYTIRFLTNQNTAMKYAKVYIKVNKKVYAAKTNKKGFATFKLTKLTKKGKYTANIIFKGDGYYNKLTKNVKIKVR